MMVFGSSRCWFWFRPAQDLIGGKFETDPKFRQQFQLASNQAELLYDIKASRYLYISADMSRGEHMWFGFLGSPGLVQIFCVHNCKRHAEFNNVAAEKSSSSTSSDEGPWQECKHHTAGTWDVVPNQFFDLIWTIALIDPFLISCVINVSGTIFEGSCWQLSNQKNLAENCKIQHIYKKILVPTKT